MNNRTLNEEYCDLKLPIDYHLHWLIAYLSLAFVGLFYAILGYRCWRLSMFVTSFGLGSLLLYIILSTQPNINELLLIGISCTIAVLFGLISALFQYVGLFINGFCFGLVISIITYLICDIRDRANGVSTSFWLIIGLILILGLICAIITLRFQKLMLIATSSCLAGVCQTLVLDYFLQLSVLLRYIHKRLLFQSTPMLCIRHWIIVLILPIVMFFGIALQFTWAGRNYDHRDSWHRVINAGKKRYQTANLNKIRKHYEQDTLRQQIIPDESNRFRHFYHIRRANGDALSTDFIQNVRQQSSTAVRLNKTTINPMTNATAPTRRDADSTTTTLSHLIY